MADTEETTQVWLVERTYSDDEQNLIILTHATPDGEHYLHKERALTSFTGPARSTYVALDVLPGKLADIKRIFDYLSYLRIIREDPR